jgi:phage terminase large subunit-like protein
VPLFDWQREAFGGATKRAHGQFIHTLGGISVPRGDGKSFAGAAVGAWRFLFGPQPQQVLSVALNTEGARIVLDHSKSIIRSHPVLESMVEIRTDDLLHRETDSWWKIRSREHTSSRGMHPSLILYDEVGWAQDDELFASLLAAQASVRDPLFLVISTVGKRKAGPLWTLKELAEAV